MKTIYPSVWIIHNSNIMITATSKIFQYFKDWLFQNRKFFVNYNSLWFSILKCNIHSAILACVWAVQGLLYSITELRLCCIFQESSIALLKWNYFYAPNTKQKATRSFSFTKFVEIKKKKSCAYEFPLLTRTSQ